MSEPSRPRPVPGPPTGAAPWAVPAAAAPAPPPAAPAHSPAAAAEPPSGDARATGGAPDAAGRDRFGDLDQRPVAEHVEVFEAEHARLERELRTIDQL
jgi:hypothetical protein